MTTTSMMKDLRNFQCLCQLTQENLQKAIYQYLLSKYNKEKVKITKDYVIAEGNIPVAIVAHSDTVFPKTPTKFYFDKEETVVWSPTGMGADDRSGILLIWKLLAETALRPHIVVVADEELGCLGAIELVRKYNTSPFKKLNFIIEIDRRGEKDAVYYDCVNKDFEEFINKFGFTTNFGSFSDISVLAPYWGVAAVNLSSGYQHEHSEAEIFNLTAFNQTYNKVVNILSSKQLKKYKYISKKGKILSFVSKTNAITCDDCLVLCEDNHRAIYWEDEADVNEWIKADTYTLCEDCFNQYKPFLHKCSKCKTYWFNPSTTFEEEHAKWVCPNCQIEEKINNGNTEFNF